ncbi:MAG TPA: sigma-70 family RNA polymerase sigma factor [Bacteroidales bacterium]|nr:sigma-70 family RNA polymerase sigma factor [Bacteroidales bacterium]
MIGINETDFDQIFLDWYYPIRNSVYYMNGDMQAAEDITQETFMKVWEKRSSINTDTIVPLLYKISKNLFLNTVDHSKVKVKFLADYQMAMFSEPADYDLEIKDFDLKLQKAISDLDEKSRTVFLMNRIDEFTYSQISENLGLSVKAVEKRMTKAIAFLKERLNVRI